LNNNAKKKAWALVPAKAALPKKTPTYLLELGATSRSRDGTFSNTSSNLFIQVFYLAPFNKGGGKKRKRNGRIPLPCGSLQLGEQALALEKAEEVGDFLSIHLPLFKRHFDPFHDNKVMPYTSIQFLFVAVCVTQRERERERDKYLGVTLRHSAASCSSWL